MILKFLLICSGLTLESLDPQLQRLEEGPWGGESVPGCVMPPSKGALMTIDFMVIYITFKQSSTGTTRDLLGLFRESSFFEAHSMPLAPIEKHKAGKP